MYIFHISTTKVMKYFELHVLLSQCGILDVAEVAFEGVLEEHGDGD